MTILSRLSSLLGRGAFPYQVLFVGSRIYNPWTDLIVGLCQEEEVCRELLPDVTRDVLVLKSILTFYQLDQKKLERFTSIKPNTVKDA